MPLVIPPDFAQCVVRWTLIGDAEELVTTYAVDASLSTATANELAATIFGIWESVFPANQINNQYKLVGARVYWVHSGGGAPEVGEHNEVHTGTDTGSVLPSNCAFLIRKQTGLGGRKHRGRMYLPPFRGTEAMVDANGNLDSTILGVLVTDMTDLYAAHFALAEDLPPYLLHSDGTTAPTPITAFQVQSKIATMRRRMRP